MLIGMVNNVEDDDDNKVDDADKLIQHTDISLLIAYLSSVRWAVNTADFNAPPQHTRYGDNTLKVTGQNHYVTSWCISL